MKGTRRSGASVPAARSGVQNPAEYPDRQDGNPCRAWADRAVLFFVAIANLFTKKIATIYGVSFTVVLFIVFIISERLNRRAHEGRQDGAREFQSRSPAPDRSRTHSRPRRARSWWPYVAII